MKKRKYKEKGIKWVMSRPGSTRRWTRGINMWDWVACPGLVFYSLRLMWSHRGVNSDTKHRPPVPSGMHYYVLPGLQRQGSLRACGSPPVPWDVSQVLGHLTRPETLRLRQRNPTQSVTHVFSPRRKNGPKSLELPNLSILINIKARSFDVSSATAKSKFLILWVVTPAVYGEVV